MRSLIVLSLMMSFALRGFAAPPKKIAVLFGGNGEDVSFNRQFQDLALSLRKF